MELSFNNKTININNYARESRREALYLIHSKAYDFLTEI